MSRVGKETWRKLIENTPDADTMFKVSVLRKRYDDFFSDMVMKLNKIMNEESYKGLRYISVRVDTIIDPQFPDTEWAEDLLNFYKEKLYSVCYEPATKTISIDWSGCGMCTEVKRSETGI